MPSASAARTLAGESSMNSRSSGGAPDALEQDLVDARLRLDDADVAGDHRDVERAQEVVLLASEGEFVGCEVAQRMDRPAGRFETPQERDVLVDRAAERLDPALMEEPQLVGEFGKGLGPRLDRGGEIRRDVGMGDEIHRQGSREKALHPRFVVERLAVEIARIPAQQNVADVEDDDQGEGLMCAGAERAPRPRRSQPQAYLDVGVYIYNIHG